MHVARPSYGFRARGDATLCGGKARRASLLPDAPVAGRTHQTAPLVLEQPAVGRRAELLHVFPEHRHQDRRNRHRTVRLGVPHLQPPFVVPITGIGPLLARHRARFPKGEHSPSRFRQVAVIQPQPHDFRRPHRRVQDAAEESDQTSPTVSMHRSHIGNGRQELASLHGIYEDSWIDRTGGSSGGPLQCSDRVFVHIPLLDRVRHGRVETAPTSLVRILGRQLAVQSVGKPVRDVFSNAGFHQSRQRQGVLCEPCAHLLQVGRGLLVLVSRYDGPPHGPAHLGELRSIGPGPNHPQSC